jgi:hypothetical protein
MGFSNYDAVNIPVISGMPRLVQHLCWAYMFYNENAVLLMVMLPKNIPAKTLAWCCVTSAGCV